MTTMKEGIRGTKKKGRKKKKEKGKTKIEEGTGGEENVSHATRPPARSSCPSSSRELRRHLTENAQPQTTNTQSDTYIEKERHIVKEHKRKQKGRHGRARATHCCTTSSYCTRGTYRKIRRRSIACVWTCVWKTLILRERSVRSSEWERARGRVRRAICRAYTRRKRPERGREHERTSGRATIRNVVLFRHAASLKGALHTYTSREREWIVQVTSDIEHHKAWPREIGGREERGE